MGSTGGAGLTTGVVGTGLRLAGPGIVVALLQMTFSGGSWSGAVIPTLRFGSNAGEVVSGAVIGSAGDRVSTGGSGLTKGNGAAGINVVVAEDAFSGVAAT